MLTTKRIGYGLRLLHDLAINAQDFRSARVLAEAYGVPETFLRRILMDLRRTGLVEAQKGRIGGYKLAKKPEEIRIAQVILALEPGGLELSYGQVGSRAGMVSVAKTCPTRPFWSRLEEKFRQVLEEATLADLIALSKKGGK